MTAPESDSSGTRELRARSGYWVSGCRFSGAGSQAASGLDTGPTSLQTTGVASTAGKACASSVQLRASRVQLPSLHCDPAQPVAPLSRVHTVVGLRGGGGSGGRRVGKSDARQKIWSEPCSRAVHPTCRHRIAALCGGGMDCAIPPATQPERRSTPPQTPAGLCFGLLACGCRTMVSWSAPGTEVRLRLRLMLVRTSAMPEVSQPE